MQSSVIGPVIVTLVAYASTLGLRLAQVDSQSTFRAEQALDAGVLESPGPNVLAIMSLEHPQALADLVWLGLVQELGSTVDGRGANWDKVERWSDIATDLDPGYLTVYHSAAVQLGNYGKRIDASDQIAEKGYQALPWAWQLALVIGYNAYFLRHDYERASSFWLRGCQTRDIPAHARTQPPPRYLCALAARARAHGGDEQGALQMLEILIETLPDGPSRDGAIYRYRALKSEDRLRAYDSACRRFRDERGRMPANGEELHDLGYVDAPPTDYLDEAIEFPEPDCVARTEQIKFREHEAIQRTRRKARSSTVTTGQKK